jgi:ssDNA-binding Zn-finger/Zn-ribbon topoisomerase 1
MISLHPDFVTSFHRNLADAAWLSSLAQFIEDRLRALAAFKSLDAQGAVRPHYNEEKFMGPLSVIKYRFEVSVKVARDISSSDRYEAQVEFDPVTARFSCSVEHVDTAEKRALRAEQLRRRSELEVLSLKALDSKANFDRQRCPICHGSLRVQFYPEGSSWAYWCAADPHHFFSDWRPVRLEPGGWWTDFVGARNCPECGEAREIRGILYGLITDLDSVDRSLWSLGGCSLTADLWMCGKCSRTFIEGNPRS